MNHPIATLRVKHGLSQLELAEAACVSRRTIVNLEGFRHRPREEARIRILEVLEAAGAAIDWNRQRKYFPTRFPIPSDCLLWLVEQHARGDFKAAREALVTEHNIDAPDLETLEVWLENARAGVWGGESVQEIREGLNHGS